MESTATLNSDEWRSLPVELSYNFIECDFLVDRKQTKFPRSKKKRIRKKWAKQEKNYSITPLPHLIRMRDNFFGHPATIAKLKKEIDEENRQSLPYRYSPTGRGMSEPSRTDV